MTKKLISYDDTAPRTGLPEVVEGKLDMTYAPATGSTVYATKSDLTEVPDNLVTSPHGLNLRLTDDPDFLGDEGDLVFYYEIWKHYLDLGATGFTGLTPRWRESPGWVEEDGYIRFNPGSGVAKAYQSVDALDTRPDATDVEIVAKIRTDSITSVYSPGVVVRGVGDADTGSCVVLSLSTGSLNLGAYVDGNWVGYRSHPTTIPAGEWIWLRLRVTGNKATGKWWVDGQEEPTTWQISHTLTVPQLLITGWAGLQTASRGGFDFAAIGVAVDGATAPVTP